MALYNNNSGLGGSTIGFGKNSWGNQNWSSDNLKYYDPLDIFGFQAGAQSKRSE